MRAAVLERIKRAAKSKIADIDSSPPDIASDIERDRLNKQPRSF